MASIVRAAKVGPTTNDVFRAIGGREARAVRAVNNARKPVFLLARPLVGFKFVRNSKHLSRSQRRGVERYRRSRL